MIPQRMYIVPLGGADVRFLGGSARARNARVAARAGSQVATLDTLDATRPAPAMLVPPATALMPGLFSDPGLADVVRAQQASRLVSPEGATVVVGPASVVLPLASRPDLLSALPAWPVGSGLLLSLSSRADRRRATTVVLRGTQKATDGFVSRTFNRPISRACSRLALAVGMNATGASLVTLLVGLACAAIAAEPGPVALAITGVLFHTASVLDGVDGEIARATLTESEMGARVDTIVDQVTYLACFAGLTVGWVREGSGMAALAWTALIGMVLVATLARAARFVRHHAPNASFVWIDRSVRRASHETGAVPLRAAAGLFTLLRRDLFAVIFLGVSFTGARALVPALILAGIVVANLTLSIYRRPIEVAAAALRAEAIGAASVPAG